MDLREAAELVLAWGRQHEAAMTLAQAVASVSVLENEIREKTARVGEARQAERDLVSLGERRAELLAEIAELEKRRDVIRAAVRSVLGSGKE
jgi:cell division protein FtsB